MRKVVVLLLTLLLIPEMALTGFFTVGAFLASTSQAPANADLVMVLGGGDGARYTRGRELLAAGYSNRLFLSHPTPAERIDTLPGVQVFVSMTNPTLRGKKGKHFVP
jgi:hypothetical protein